MSIDTFAMRPPVTGALQHLRRRQLARGGITPSLFLVYKLPPTTDPLLSPSIARRIAIRGRAPANLMSRLSCIMRHSPAASAATTVSGGTATPSVRPQGAPRGRSRPRSRLSAGRSANARRSPVLRPSPTGIEGRRRKLQAPLSFGRRPAARPAVCEAVPYPFQCPPRAERGPCRHCPAAGAPRSRAAERLQGSFRAPQRPQPQRPAQPRYRSAHLWPYSHSRYGHRTPVRLGPITWSAGDIGGKCEQRTSESNDNHEDDCSIPQHATPQTRSSRPIR